MRAEFPPFVPRAPWWNGDLQTLRNQLVPGRPGLGPVAGERIWLDLDDGSGDSLAAVLHRPPDSARAPLVVVIHGLTGCEDSHYVRTSTAVHIARGNAVLRLNLRGAGPSRARCRLSYHAGRSDDLVHALEALDPGITANGIMLIGYSLGGNMLLKFLAEYSGAEYSGAEYSGAEYRGRPAIVAAATVSAPIDLMSASARFLAPRNRFYHRWILRKMKSECEGPLVEMTARERRAVASARTIYAFDRDFTGPRNGYEGADDYYGENSALRFLPGISVPTLMVHGADDPWIPAADYRRAVREAPPGLEILLCPRGGHVGFHGRHRIPWHDRCISMFFDRFTG